MSTPICSQCCERTLLCKSCQEKYDKKLVNPLEVELSRIFSKLFPETGFKAAVSSKDVVFILVEKSDVGKIIGKGGSGLKNISHLLNDRKIKVVGVDDFEKMAKELCAPAEVKKINEVYASVKKYKIVISSKNELRIQPQVLETLLSRISSAQIILEFEKK